MFCPTRTERLREERKGGEGRERERPLAPYWTRRRLALAAAKARGARHRTERERQGDIAASGDNRKQKVYFLWFTKPRSYMHIIER